MTVINRDQLRDPLIDEVRAVRQAIEQEAGGDLHAIVEAARKAGEDFRRGQDRRKQQRDSSKA